MHRFSLPWLLSSLAGVSVCIAFWPGALDIDGVVQLQQARLHHYGDWFPPLMAVTWSVLDRVIAGSGGMLILQNVLFWSGVALLQRTWLPIALMLFPPTSVWLGTVCKDSLMVGALALAIGLLQRRKLGFLIAAIYAAAVKHRAELAALPLVFTRRGAVVFALCLVACPRMITAALTDEREYPTQQVMLHDLAALSDAPPAAYRPLSLDPLLWGPERVARARTQDELDVLFARWRKEVLAQPLRYLGHRAEMMGALLTSPTLYAIAGTPSRPEPATFYKRAWVRWTFQPCIWLSLDAFLLYMCWRRPLARAVLIGALLYAISFFPSLPSPQFRYLLWPCLAWFFALGIKQES